MAKLSDTSPEAEHVLIEAYRRMPVGRKWLSLGEVYGTARILHSAGFRQRRPSGDDWEAHRDWLTINQEFTGPLPRCKPPTDWNGLNLRTIREVARVLDDLAIPYALGGSMASSVYGFLRHCRGADVVAGSLPGGETAFAGAWGPEYHLSRPVVGNARRDHPAIHLLNTLTGFKVNVFIRKDAPFELTAMQRRISLHLPDAPDQPIVFHTPEDTILFKLRWYRLGGESSEQQLKDVVGVLQVQAGKLDQTYLDRWAADLGVADLLARVRQQSAS
jgi:hypothetical protein